MLRQSAPGLLLHARVGSLYWVNLIGRLGASHSPVARGRVTWEPYSWVMGSCLSAVAQQRDEIHVIADRHRARSISVFGSVARGEDRPDSDVDFLVEFEPGASLLDLMRIQDELEALLGCPVDVLSVGGLKDRDEQIRREAIPV